MTTPTDGNASSTAGADDSTDKGPSYVAQIYDQLKALFGATSTTSDFIMEFPGRVLDATSYAYPITGPYSALAKPQIVAEAEFRLTDSLFDLPNASADRAIVNGPNGQQLSLAYQRALNLFVPQVTKAEATYAGDKEKLRAWLNELVDAGQGKDGTPVKATRMERPSVRPSRH